MTDDDTAPATPQFFDEEFFRPEVISTEIMRVCEAHDLRLAELWATGHPVARDAFPAAVLTAMERVCQEHGDTLDQWIEFACPSRYDPEGEHEAGYRCTLLEGHLGDHQAAGTTPGEPVHAWGTMEGLAVRTGQEHQR